MRADSRASLIVYGNCQAEAVVTSLRADMHFTSILQPVYLRSFEHPVEGRATLDAKHLSRAALLWEQHDPVRFPYADRLKEQVMAVTFPSADLQLLFPFNCVNPYNAPEPPVFPFGRFAYGDRAILRAIDRGMTRGQVLEYYLTQWDDYKIDLDRFMQMETARLRARDEKCDISIGDFVLANFRKERLFWTVNHPTSLLLAELIERLLAASDLVDPALADSDITATLATQFQPEGPLGIVSVPIHPRVADHLRLEWYDPNERYRMWDGSTYSYEEYFDAMIAHAFKMREEGTALPIQAR